MIRLLTMSDLRLLPQALMLHGSIASQTAGFGREVKLTLLCMDEATESFLQRRPRAGMELLHLRDLERADPELASTRTARSWREYCWTAIPALCRYSLSRAGAGSLTGWLDADIELLDDVRALVDALGDGSILLTPHCYNRAYPAAATAGELTERYGRFNGGSVAFRRDQQGLAAANLWRERTLQWCADRPEPGRYGNQVYLDDFPSRFSRARILAVPGGILGPWNGGRYSLNNRAERLTADGKPLYGYHFQSLRLRRASAAPVRWVSPNTFALGSGIEVRAEPHYRITRHERRLLWRPYLRRLEHAVVEVRAHHPAFASALPAKPSLSERLGSLQTALALRTSLVFRPLMGVWWCLRGIALAAAARGRPPRAHRRP